MSRQKQKIRTQTMVGLEPRHRDIIREMIDGDIPGVRAETMSEAIRASLEYVKRESTRA